MSRTQIRPTILPPGLLPVTGFFRLTVDEYHEMIRNNILTADDRVELLDGYLVNKMPQDTPHSSTLDRVATDLLQLVPKGWRVRPQLPITLAESEPEPDVAVVRGDRRTYDSRQPGPADFGFVIEIADSSLSRDRALKGVLYAAARIPAYWVINIPNGQIEVFTAPDPSATPPVYTTRTIYLPGQDVPVVLDGLQVGTIPVADLLP